MTQTNSSQANNSIYRAYKLQGGNPTTPDASLDSTVAQALITCIDGQTQTNFNNRTSAIAQRMQEEGWRFTSSATVTPQVAIASSQPCLGVLNALVAPQLANQLADKAAENASTGQQQHQHAKA